MTTTNSVKFYSIAQVAKQLGMNTTSIWHRIQSGRVKAMNVNEGEEGRAKWIISQTELDRLLLIQKLERHEQPEEIA